MMNFIDRNKYLLFLFFLLQISYLFYEKDLDGQITIPLITMIISLVSIWQYLVYKFLNYFILLKNIYLIISSILITFISMYSASFISFLFFESIHNNRVLNFIYLEFVEYSSFGEPEPSISFILFMIIIFIILYSSLFIGTLKILKK